MSDEVIVGGEVASDSDRLAILEHLGKKVTIKEEVVNEMPWVDTSKGPIDFKFETCKSREEILNRIKKGLLGLSQKETANTLRDLFLEFPVVLNDFKITLSDVLEVLSSGITGITGIPGTKVSNSSVKESKASLLEQCLTARAETLNENVDELNENRKRAVISFDINLMEKLFGKK